MQVPRKMKGKKGDKERGHAGTIAFEQRQGRERTNSEETAMILTSMSVGGGSAAPDKSTDAIRIKTENGEEEDALINPGTKYIPSLARFDEVDRAKYISSYAKFKDEEDGEGWSSDGSDGTKRRTPTNAASRMKYHATKFISIEELREHFDQPIVEVARYFGICITLMKKVCRRNGIKRWPHRQIRSLTKSISSMEAAMMTATGAEREKYEGQIQTLKKKRDAVIADPNKEVSVSLSKCDFKEEKKEDVDEAISQDGSESPLKQAQGKDEANPQFILPATRPRPPPQQYEAKGGRWTAQEHAAFLEGIKLFGKNWRRVAQVVGTRNAVQTRTHAQKYLLKTSSHLELHLALLKKENVDDDDVGLEEEANAAVLTSLTQAKPAPPAKEVEAGMDRLSSLMLKAESMHNHLMESGDAIRSPLDALNFSAPLILSPRWSSEKGSAGPASPGMRKLALARKSSEEDRSPKKQKVEQQQQVPENNENVSPNTNSTAPNASASASGPASQEPKEATKALPKASNDAVAAADHLGVVVVQAADVTEHKETSHETTKTTPGESADPKSLTTSLMECDPEMEPENDENVNSFQLNSGEDAVDPFCPHI